MLKQYTAIGLMLCASTVMCTQYAAAETAPASEVKILQDRPVSWMRAPKVKFEPGDLEGRPFQAGGQKAHRPHRSGQRPLAPGRHRHRRLPSG